MDHSDRITDGVFQVHTGKGLGTAFRIGEGYWGNDAGGFVEDWLTAAHVVGDHRQVTLTNGTASLAAEVVGLDHAYDIAVLRTKLGNAEIVTLRFGKAAWLKPGADLYAVGYPLHEATQPTVSRGVLSRIEEDTSLAREVVSEGTLILTDAAINAGNSGGPLVDACGSVIGMNVAGLVAVDVEGINWAVAATTLQEQYVRIRANVAAAHPLPEPAPAPAGTGAWEYFDGDTIWGSYEGYALPEENYQSHLYVRCAVKSITGAGDSVFFRVPHLVSNHPEFGAASAGVAYRFSDQDYIIADIGFWSNEEPESTIFAPQHLIDEISTTTADTLYFEVNTDNNGSLYLTFHLAGIDAVVAALDCL